MKTKIEVEKEAIKYLKNNRELLFNTYLDKYFPIDEKVAYFTAGPSGAGKTEFIQQFLEVENNLVHLDIDNVRDFFIPIGYDGSNSDVFQKPASWGIQFLFDEIIKTRELSLVADSNLSHFQTAKENSVIKSRNTTFEIKKLFDKNIILNIVDKRDNKYYENIDATQFLEIIPEYKEKK